MSHFTIGVADQAKTVAFYQSLFAADIQVRQGAAPAYGIGPGVHFLMFIGGGPGRGGAAPAPPRIDHACMAMNGFDPAAVTKTLTGYGLKPLPNASREPLVTYISLRMPNRGGAEGGTPELYFTDPDGLAIQLQDVTYCGGAGFLGDRLPAVIRGPHMRTRSIALLITGLSVALASGQSKLPPDIDSTSFSRLAPVDRAALDDDGKKVWDYIANGRALPATGPAQVSMHSPGAAKPIHELNQYLRKTVVGPRFFELSALIAAREFDQQYEWSGHEPAGRRAGLEQNVDRRREVQSRCRRPHGEGRHGDPPRTGTPPRSQGEPGALGEDR